MPRTRSPLLALVVVGAAILTAPAAGADRTATSLAAVVHPGCSATTVARPPNAVATPARAARTSALQLYDDEILDVVSAPDICQSNAVTNDNHVMTFGLHIHDRSGFAASDTYELVLDTDSNPATGAPAESGPTAGAEFVIGLAADESTLSAWDGSAFTPVTPQPEIPTLWAEDFGPILEIDRGALGNPQALNLLVRTANASDIDLAPDSGAWSYTVMPLRLTVARFGVTSAKAGKPFGAAMEVTRSDFDIALDEGAIACKAAIAGRTLAGRGRFLTDLATCGWRIPKSARGKRVRGTIAVAFQGVTVKRAFSTVVK